MAKGDRGQEPRQGLELRAPSMMTVTVPLFVVFALMVVFTPGSLTILVAGMMPTVAAVITDRTPYRMAALTVGATNLAGTLPFIVAVWRGGDGVAGAVALLSSPWPWGVMYVAAAGGWGLLWLGPMIARLAVAVLADLERRRLEKIQAELVATWGRGVIDA